MIPSDGMSVNSGDSAAKFFENHGSALSEEEKSFLTSVKHWPNVWGECVTALLLQRSLAKHATALNAAAVASNRNAKSLTWATWALVFVTAVLVVIGIFNNLQK